MGILSREKGARLAPEPRAAAVKLEGHSPFSEGDEDDTEPWALEGALRRQKFGIARGLEERPSFRARDFVHDFDFNDSQSGETTVDNEIAAAAGETASSSQGYFRFHTGDPDAAQLITDNRAPRHEFVLP